MWHYSPEKQNCSGKTTHCGGKKSIYWETMLHCSTKKCHCCGKKNDCGGQLTIYGFILRSFWDEARLWYGLHA